MKNKYVFVTVMLLTILVASVAFTGFYTGGPNRNEEEEFVVVTSFYPMYIATMNVIGDTEGVTLKNLSEPQTGCLHDFQLTPADMKLLSTADVFVMNGGGIESFVEEIALQYPHLTIIDASEGLELLCEDHDHEEEAGEEGDDSAHDHREHDHGEVNAHAWMSVPLYRKQIANITKGLAEVDMLHMKEYNANCLEYDGKLAKLEEKQQEVRESARKHAAILFHCAFDYVTMDLEMDTAFCMDLDGENPVGAGQMAEVLDIIRKDGVNVIFAEALYGEDICNMIAREADVKIAYLNPVTRGDYHKDSYLSAMEQNLETILSVLQR